MSTPKAPDVTPAPVPTEIDPGAQAKADETARKAKQRQQAGVSPTSTILTAGLDDDELKVKKSSLGA